LFHWHTQRARTSKRGILKGWLRDHQNLDN
jgi:hypothetical protein